LSIAPFHAESLSIPARGLSGQTYKGAVFWDTEMFMLDFFLNCQPGVARTLLRYRIDTLSGAQKKAAQYGYQGAFYAWESQEGGFDACSDYNVTDVFTGRPMRTYFKDKQIHISAAIVYGLVKYLERTGDKELLYTGGAKVILECAKFYDSMLLCKAHTELYELRDVIGPDEYHERVNNNGYTNRMAKFVFEEACNILNDSEADEKLLQEVQEYKKQGFVERFKEDAEKLYIPKPDQDGIVAQFDGYRDLEDTTVNAVRNRLLNEREYWGGAYGVASDTQIIKQADVITWMVMFPEDFTEEQKWHNWKYYEPRTEHGSSLSACMYSILACVCGHQEEAYPFFRKSAEADKKGGGKEWAGDIYIGGTHPAAAGGAYMTAIFGFGGVRVKG
ncbi:MAG: glycoside hydrolase family 65 protein, partial [Lachnospiraceae bacterium]|nr:glycoside hydrolase family 65 protein [Lachnospiraceae bacterium]